MAITPRDALTALTEAGSFRSAASSLGISQPYLTQLIQRLEDNCHGVLINRHQKPITLTELGLVFLESRKKIDAIEAEVRQYCADLANLQTGSLKIVCPAERTIAMLTEPIAAFMRQHPGINIDISSVMDLNQIPHILAQGKADIGILIRDLLTPELNAFSLFKEKFLLAIPNTSDFKTIGKTWNETGQYPCLAPADGKVLKDLPFLQTIGYDERVGIISKACNQAIKPLNLRVTTLGERMAFVEAGLCSAICQETLITSHSSRLNCRFLSLEKVFPLREVLVVWDQRIYQSRAARAFCDSLLKRYHQKIRRR